MTSSLNSCASLKISSGIIMDALRKSSRISGKERIRNVTIRQQIGLEETIIKKIEQNQLTWYGHVQRRQKENYPKWH
jgi:hypothetical protein